MVTRELQYGSGVFESKGISRLCLACSLVPFSSDPLAHLGYPVGVVGWLVGDESNRSTVNEHRIVQNCGS